MKIVNIQPRSMLRLKQGIGQGLRRDLHRGLDSGKIGHPPVSGGKMGVLLSTASVR